MERLDAKVSFDLSNSGVFIMNTRPDEIWERSSTGTVPHGLRTFHEKSTYPDAMNRKALCGTNMVT